MTIYTKKGDEGNTSLFGGSHVSKSSVRVEAYGSIDELNSWIGLVLSNSLSEEVSKMLRTIQEHLLVLGADLAAPPSSTTRIGRINEEHVLFLEQNIDLLQQNLPELKNFILPGGAQTGASLHIARTICRRTERRVVSCAHKEEISSFSIKYLNRLSDFLFVAARFENKQADTAEKVWKPNGK